MPRVDAPHRSDTHETRILVVDDSLMFRRFLSSQLKKEGYHVQDADNAESALERARLEPFDGFVVDLRMPGMDGIELCRELDQIRVQEGSCFVIVVVTAHEDSDDISRALEAGADDFITKSSELPVVKARIRGLLRRKQFEEENTRISDELRRTELETVKARAEAEARAAVAEELSRANQELEASNRRLRETQTQLIQSEKMASMGQLIAGIAHEINNPLAFVLTNIYNIQSWLKDVEVVVTPQLEGKLRDRFERIQPRLADVSLGLTRVKDLVLRLRTFSRLDEGEFKTVDVHENIDSVLMLLGYRLKPGSVKLVKEYGFSGWLDCFPGQLNQVVMNVVSNALDAVQGIADPTITIRTGRVEGDFLLTVEDNGPGIPEDAGRRVFEPFFTTKAAGQGTGLGMAISQRIVQAHRGQIRFQSSPPAGTRFEIRIPLDLGEQLKQRGGDHGDGRDTGQGAPRR